MAGQTTIEEPRGKAPGCGPRAPETVRARRKRIYRKLHVGGVADMLSGLLATSIQLLAQGEERPASPAGDVAGGLGANRTDAARNVAVGMAQGSSPLPASP